MANIEELNAFYDRLETQPLSTSAISLWHALAFVRDKNGLDGWFAVAASTLCAKSGIKERSFYSARNQLIDKGFVEFKTRGGNKSGLYKINLCTANNADKSSCTANNADNYADKSKTKRRQNVDKPSLLVRQIDRQKEGHARANFFADIEEAWTEVFKIQMKPNHVERIYSHIEQDGMSETLVLEGIERAKKSDQRALNYLWRTLTDWAQHEIRTIQNLIDYEKTHKQNQERPKTRAQQNLRAIDDYKRKHGIGGVSG